MKSNWNEVKIDDICSIRRGASPRPIQKYISERGIPWVKIADATSSNSRFINETKEFIIEEGKEKSRYIEKGTLILSNSATPGLPKFMNINGCVHDGWLILDGFKGVYDNFLYYNLIENRIKLLTLSNGSVFRNLKTDIVKNFNIKLPPLEEQKAIAKILSDLDEKIEVNNKINKNLEEMAQVIFKQWFVDFEFPNEEGKPYKSSGGEMVESELGMIPKGWKCCSLSEIVEISTKSEKPFENKNIVYEHFSLPACDNGKRAVKELGSLISSNKYKIDNNSILISKMNPMTKRIWNPLCKSSNAICSTEFIVYKPKLDFAKSFCYEVINSKKFTDFLVSNATGSTGSRQRVKPKETLNYRLVLPKANVITNVAEKLESIHLKIKLNIEENERLEKLRDTLLPKLMSGEIRVPLEYSEN
ncbi:restriction endonuclease subunit S [Clostridium perfringens]|uniref:restriction endonuclease subunit S n=1 Tax=Clostridium perfringens TaxID=1502 RepID=UPI001CE01C15|nr:restriction endonuclease subunit S [Clostridium perfringens]EGT0696508.1 restriction endonuclease subunit S [Clostridium perfringens]EGT3602354.1 restriction endonuclease subunit S [Clostridium perfringens]MCC5433170.1 restriction endonuclease subunit S [Clostridium perfringens]MCC5435845.1 restriction endonuclease subunit S [Clostridium perfringens]MDH5084378.1 EcoKI restriction-modification system protein HsdS [Clostridium perfringens]